jgi:hypothetical protein
VKDDLKGSRVRMQNALAFKVKKTKILDLGVALKI